jgi:hypothetical protein
VEAPSEAFASVVVLCKAVPFGVARKKPVVGHL